MDGSAPSLGSWHRHNVTFLHKVHKLAWDLLKGLLGEFCWIIPEFTEGHELNNIGVHILLVSLRVQRHIIGIQDIHALEVITADTDDDNRQGQGAATHDLVNGFLHVIDDSVGNDQQDVVLLIDLVHLLGLGQIVDELDDRREVSWTV